MDIYGKIFICVFASAAMFILGFSVSDFMYEKRKVKIAEEVTEKMMYMCGCRNCITKVEMIILGNVKPIENQCNNCGIYDKR